MVRTAAVFAVKKGIGQILHTRLKTTCLPSPAKLNLGLRIVGRRADGYHLLESLFWPLAFVDDLEVEEASRLSVEMAWRPDAPKPSAQLPQDRENLVYRAVETALGASGGLRLRIGKRIPLGAGLGGGSSNAGVVLKHLADQGRLGAGDAASVALGLGADVPFFLGDGPEWVEGIGEKRQAVRVAPEIVRELSFLLVLPPESTPTPIIFSRYRALGIPFAPRCKTDFSGELDWPRLAAYLAEAENSLEGIAAVQYPLLGDILSRLKKQPALYSGLSGTGSTCFAVFRSESASARAAQDLQGFCRKSGCQTLLTKTFAGR